MFAIVDILGQQFKVQAGQKVYVHRLSAEEGAEVNFDKVLLTSDGGSNIQIQPNNTSVSVTVLKHLKGDKVIVFKKKRRKGYKVKNGHRQSLSQITINSINV